MARRLPRDAGGDFLQRHQAEVFAEAQADRRAAGRRLLVAHHEHTGRLLQLRVADLRVHALAAGVDVGAEPRLPFGYGHALAQGELAFALADLRHHRGVGCNVERGEDV